MRFGPIHQMISHGCFADLYRLVKPLPDEDDESEGCYSDGHSFFHHRGSSRIVLPLVFLTPHPTRLLSLAVSRTTALSWEKILAGTVPSSRALRAEQSEPRAQMDGSQREYKGPLT